MLTAFLKRIDFLHTHIHTTHLHIHLSTGNGRKLEKVDKSVGFVSYLMCFTSIYIGRKLE